MESVKGGGNKWWRGEGGVKSGSDGELGGMVTVCCRITF